MVPKKIIMVMKEYPILLDRRIFLFTINPKKSSRASKLEYRFTPLLYIFRSATLELNMNWLNTFQGLFILFGRIKDKEILLVRDLFVIAGIITIEEINKEIIMEVI